MGIEFDTLCTTEKAADASGEHQHAKMHDHRKS